LKIGEFFRNILKTLAFYCNFCYNLHMDNCDNCKQIAAEKYARSAAESCMKWGMTPAGN